jgi:hypothetical protein
MDELGRVGYLLSPILLGWLAHGLSMSRGWGSRLARPIDRGATFRGKPLFGANKTWRGVVVIGLGTAVGFAIQSLALHSIAACRSLEYWDYARPETIGIGFLVGAAGMLGELPNSFLKRQFDVGPGDAGRGLPGAAFFLLDQFDLLIGVWPVLALVMAPTWSRVAASALLLLLVHPLATLAGFLLGMRKSAR